MALASAAADAMLPPTYDALSDTISLGSSGVAGAGASAALAHKIASDMFGLESFGTGALSSAGGGAGAGAALGGVAFPSYREAADAFESGRRPVCDYSRD